VSLERALALAERGRGTAHPNPIVGCVIVRDGTVVGEGWHEQAGRPHAEVVALRSAGERARGATVFLTMEPCTHHGRTPPCADALIEAGVSRAVLGCRDPNPEAAGGLERLRAAGIEVTVDEGELGFLCRQQNEAWRTWIVRGRPFVLLKLAVTLDGSVIRPGARWVSGEDARRRVHELRAQVDAVAVGMGTARADQPALTARDVGTLRQPRRIVFGRGPLPAGSELELRDGPLADELVGLAREGVQSLLLEGGPTIAGAFLRADLVDKLLLFLAPTIAGAGIRFAPELEAPLELTRLAAAQVGEDVLLSGYVHAP
jgi:diaminohydroxyphosphoribosylaminopyrimidine deaminase / 5-amino-6-(5-phosphoribosylamino)uracil reductase